MYVGMTFYPGLWHSSKRYRRDAIANVVFSESLVYNGQHDAASDCSTISRILAAFEMTCTQPDESQQVKTMSAGEALIQLQQIDLAILQHRKRLQEIDKALQDSEVIHAAQARVMAVEAALAPHQKQVRQIEQDIQTAAAKRKATETRLYSGNVKNPKELQDMEHEIEALTRRNADLEDQMLEAMLEVEAAQATLEAAQAELARITREFEQAHTDLLSEQSDHNAQVAQLTSKREQVLPRIPADLLTRYKDLRPKKGYQPVAKLEDDTCSACGIQLTSQRAQTVKQGDTLHNCQNCGRILVYTGR